MGRKLTFYRKKQNFGLMTFFIALILAAVIFTPFIIYNKGYFLYYGDFNVQQIPFYQMIHDQIRSGNFFWSNTTDLGANTVGSYSFYLLGSPFFWITLLFPSKAVPHLMGPLLILKLSCASVSGYVYLKRYVQNRHFAVLGGLIYGFSGFSIYNIFFNHFHEAIIIFPLLLASIDAFMCDKRRGLVPLTVCFACVFNYYFFVGQVIFVLIYWVLRMLTKSYRSSVKEFFILFFEVILGFLMSCVILIPSVLAIIGNDRVASPILGWNAVLYPITQRYLHILQSLFFPPDIPARPNFTPDSNSKWASVAAWMPLYSMCGVITFLQLKKKWLKKMLFILFLMMGIPLLNSAFQIGNSSYYARWYYMLTLMLALATVFTLDNVDAVNMRRGIFWCAGITLTVSCLVGLIPAYKTDEGSDRKYLTYGVEAYPDRFWIYVAITLLCLAALFFIITFFKNNKRAFIIINYCALSLIIVTYSCFTIGLGKSHGYSGNDFIIPYCLNGGEDLKLDDIKEVRSDFYETMDNVGMFWQIPNIQAFHSIVPASTMKFYQSAGVTRDVASRPETKYYGLRGLLSVKYLFDFPDDGDDFSDEDGSCKMPGYVYKDNENGFDVYENRYYIPMGFTYNSFISEEEYELISTEQRHLALLKSMVLSQEDMEKYSDITHYDKDNYKKLNSVYSEENNRYITIKKETGFKSQIEDFDYDYENYFADCEKLKENCCYSFEYVKNGFSAKIINKDDDNLLFFSVPYDEGWSAYVNGEKAEIIKSNVGFMAVKIDGHTKSEIKFEYKTPGLIPGLIISAGCAFVYIIYAAILIIKLRKNKHNNP